MNERIYDRHENNPVYDITINNVCFITRDVLANNAINGVVNSDRSCVIHIHFMPIVNV